MYHVWFLKIFSDIFIHFSAHSLHLETIKSLYLLINKAQKTLISTRIIVKEINKNIQTSNWYLFLLIIKYSLIIFKQINLSLNNVLEILRDLLLTYLVCLYAHNVGLEHHHQQIREDDCRLEHIVHFHWILSKQYFLEILNDSKTNLKKITQMRITKVLKVTYKIIEYLQTKWIYFCVVNVLLQIIDHLNK